MAKASDKQKRLMKIYREYARIKFKKYKLQFPRLRETEIVNKILSEWEALDEEAKNNLGEEFTARSGEQFLLVSSSSSREKEKEKQKTMKVVSTPPDPTVKPKKSSPKVRVFGAKLSPEKLVEELDVKKDTSDFRRSEEGQEGKKDTPSKSSSEINYLEKTKKIAKLERKSLQKSRKVSEQATFSKYYYDKLASEHPRWSKLQIQTIVRLLWRKRSSKKSIRSLPKKGLSGRQMYRREKQSQGFLRDQIKAMWKILPHESKIFWAARGGKRRVHRSERTTSRQVKRVLNGGAIRTDSFSEKTGFGWMEQVIG